MMARPQSNFDDAHEGSFEARISFDVAFKGLIPDVETRKTATGFHRLLVNTSGRKVISESNAGGGHRLALGEPNIQTFSTAFIIFRHTKVSKSF